MTNETRLYAIEKMCPDDDDDDCIMKEKCFDVSKTLKSYKDPE